MQAFHDRSYQKLFSNKEIFRQLLTSFVHESWVKDLDFSGCELIKSAFVSRKYKKTFSDLLYKLKLRDRDLYVVILLEFKSAPAWFVAVQIAGYILDFYRHLIDSEKRLRKLPPVFPILLYNGKRRWTSPTDLSEVVEGTPILGKYGLQFKYFPIIERAFPPRLLKRIGNIVSTLFLAETHYDSEVLIREFKRLRYTIKNKKALSLFFNWFTQMFLHGRIDDADYSKLEKVHYSKAEVGMLIEAIQKEKSQIRAQGKREGKREGKKEGKLEIARAMLQNGESVDQIARYTGLAEATLLKLQKARRN